jgi:malate/lactate dehydrogenase
MTALTVAIAGGAGGVGSSLAFNLLLRPEPYDVAVVDRRPQKVLSHVMDLEQVLALGGGRSVRRGEPEDLEKADVVVVCAAAPLTESTSRTVYLHDNAQIVGGIAARLAARGEGWRGVLIMVTNPVDALCTWVVERYGLDRRRVLGYTLNDSLRLRTAIAARLQEPPGDVGAYVLGEHGEAAVPVFSRVTLRGAPVALDAAARAAAATFVRTWYRRHVALDARRSSTWTSGAGAARMVAALGGAPQAAPWPASVTLAGEYGIAGAAVTVPVTLGRGGAERIHEWPLAPEERAGLAAAAEAVRRAAAALEES